MMTENIFIGFIGGGNQRKPTSCRKSLDTVLV
jgi:hypothetical protein